MILKKILMVTLTVVAAYSGKADAQTFPIAKVPFCSTPPNIDGKLDDPQWKDAYESSCFYEFTEKKAVDLKSVRDTVLKITADKEWIYLGVECLHPTPRDLVVGIKENYGGRIWGDESVKFFITPGSPNGGYFRYVLNADGFYSLDKLFMKKSWSSSPAWPSATARGDKGWSAEIAVPLYYLAKYGDLSQLRMNVFRKKIINDYDDHGVIVGEETMARTWSPTSTWTDYAEMGRVEELGRYGVKPPFIANAIKLGAGTFVFRDGAFSYPLSMTLKALTTTAGTVELLVSETLPNGQKKQIRKTVLLRGNGVQAVTVEVPVNELSQRIVSLSVLNAGNGMMLQKLALKDTSSFNLLNASTRLNYYTEEKMADIQYTIGLPQDQLKDFSIVVLDTKGKELTSLKELTSKGSFPLPLSTLPYGDNVLRLALMNQDGKQSFYVNLTLTKLPPKPGHEVKVDRRSGCLVRNGIPYFPFGALADVNDSQFAEMAAAGFNSVIWWWSETIPFPTVLELAEKHGLNVVVRPEKIPKKIFQANAEKAQTVKDYLSGDKMEKARKWLNRFASFKNFYKFTPQMPRQKRNEIAAEVFALNIPEALKNVRASMNFSSLLAYKTIDEPLFLGQDMDVDCKAFYLAVKNVDPYHPMFALYSSKIPGGAGTTSFMDCIGTDPYWTPGRQSRRMTINWVAEVTAKTVKRARKADLMPWCVLQATLWSDTLQRSITAKEQVCQTYLALINGSKGIFYFTHGLFFHIDHWNAVKRLAAQIKILTPALTSPSPEQRITYSPGECRPLEDVFPDAQASVFHFPGGADVLLLANMKEYPLDLTIRVDGLNNGYVRRFFDDTVPPVEKNSFSETVEAMGVRAYSLSGIKREPIKIHIDIKAKLGTWKQVLGYEHEGRQDRRNIMPNGSFEQESVKGWPDYCNPLSIRTGWKKRVGEEGSPIGLTREAPFHGDKCLFSKSHCFYFRIAPQHKTAQPYVLSFYARTSEDKPIKVRAWGQGFSGDVVVEGTEWKRYAIPGVIPANVNTHGNIFIRPYGGVAYFDALQLEHGDKPTPYAP